ncbi:MAG: energy transducer TonB [Acidobacteriota bacterium]|nr:energy transducer TonB [Acidobacteriota bacterium]
MIAASAIALALPLIGLSQNATQTQLENTAWVSESVPVGGAYVFELRLGGNFRATSFDGTVREGTWSQDGGSIHIRVKELSAEYSGVVEGGRMKGKAKDKAGREWPWSARRQEATPLASSVVTPLYPAIAGAARAEGVVNVEVKVDKAGHVSSASALNGHPLLQQVAVEAARRWTFNPEADKEVRAVRLFFMFHTLPQDCRKRLPDPEPKLLSAYEVEIKHREGCMDYSARRR